MATRHASASFRSIWTLLGIAASSAVFGTSCNAILGIEKGHLVGAGGSSGHAGKGGNSPEVDASGTGGSLDSGAGGLSTGGSAGAAAGGKSTGGNAGAGGSGAGGASTGGGGTGGNEPSDSGTGGVGGASEPAGVPGEVHCGTSSCKLPGQLCCIETATGSAHCATSCDSTSQLPVSCDGSEDCPNGRAKCCYPTGGTTATCMASCQGRVFCGKDADCAAGQRCAPGAGALASVFVCVNVPKARSVWCAGSVCDTAASEVCCYDKTTKTEKCATACPAAGVRFACDGPEDCMTGASCCETRTGLGLFTGTQCVAGSCAAQQAELTCGGSNGCTTAGDRCCLQGSGSSCAATCPAETVCGTGADCSAGESCTVVTDTAIGMPTGRTVCGPTR